MGKVAPALVKAISEIVGAENVHIVGERFDAASKDATEVVSRPHLAVSVTAADQIPALLKLALQYNLNVVARGAGTGLSGGSVAAADSIVLMLDKLDRIISIDTDKCLAVVEPGVITQSLADAALAQGLFYPPDPASVDEATLGGNVAECAGGLRCKKYGVTKDYVLGLEGYTIAGELVQTGCFVDGETYDLSSLLIGSEGTLLLITKIALQLVDPPEAQRTFLVTFARQGDAADVVARLLSLGVVPAVLEFMDGDAVACSLDYLQQQGDQFHPELVAGLDAEALLLVELDGRTSEISRDSVIVDEVVRRHGPVLFRMTNDEAERETLWQIRRSLSKAVTAAAPLRVSEDVCVPPSRLPALVGILPQLARDFELRVNSYGHAGDGNLHVNFLYPIDNEEGRALIARAALELFKMTLNLEGTISGEHGIGLAKREFLPLEIEPTTMELLRLVKRAFDPKSRLNPDKIFRTSS